MKLSGWTIILIGLCLGLSAFAFVLFQVYMPSEEAAGYMRDYQAKLETEANKQTAAVNRVKKAQFMVQTAAQQWSVFASSKTPPAELQRGGVNIFENPYQLVVDSPKYRNSAQRAFNAQLHAGGVKVISAPEIPFPTDSEKDILASYYNYPAFTFPVVLWELGTVTVTGTYDQIVKNMRAWSSMPHYLAVADGLRLDGTSPVLTGSYNVTIVGFIRGNQVYPPPAVVMASAGSTQQGGPAGPGGPTGPGGPGAAIMGSAGGPGGGGIPPQARGGGGKMAAGAN